MLLKERDPGTPPPSAFCCVCLSLSFPPSTPLVFRLLFQQSSSTVSPNMTQHAATAPQQYSRVTGNCSRELKIPFHLLTWLFSRILSQRLETAVKNSFVRGVWAGLNGEAGMLRFFRADPLMRETGRSRPLQPTTDLGI